jgi:hypothetical protein
MDASTNYKVFTENGITPLDTKSLVSDLQDQSEVLIAPCMDVVLTLPRGNERLVQMRWDVTMGGVGDYARAEFPRWSLVAMSGRFVAPDDRLETLAQDGKVALRLTARVHDICVTGPDQERRNYRVAAEIPIENLKGIFAADMGIEKGFEVQDAKKQLRKDALVSESSGELRLLVQDEPPAAIDRVNPRSSGSPKHQQGGEPDLGEQRTQKRQRGGRGGSRVLSRSGVMRQGSDQDLQLKRSTSQLTSREEDLQTGGLNRSRRPTTGRQSVGLRPVYPFKYEDEIAKIEVDPGLTVAQLIPIVAARFNTEPESVKLLHLGKVLKENLEVDKLRITAKSPVLVHISDMEAKLLTSFVSRREPS